MQKLLCLILAGLLAGFCAGCAAPQSVFSSEPTPSAAAPVPASERPEPTSPKPTQEPEPEFTLCFTEDDVIMVAKIMEVECPHVPSQTRQAAVAWTICNRADAGMMGCTTIAEVCTYPNQFAYYPDTPVRESMLELSEDVLTRWSMERSGLTDVGRVIPPDVMWFTGDGRENYFRNAYRGGEIWDWSLPSPYET